MRHALEIQPIRLPARSIHRLEDAAGQQVTALDGVLWVTQANDPRDLILTRGQSITVERNGVTLLFALENAAVTVGPPGHIAAVQVDPLALKDVAA